MARPRTPLRDKLAAYLDRPNECWFLPNKPGPYGYVVISSSWRQGHAHRFVYEEFVGPIPDGMQIDHLCRNRACMNPRHLEPVTSKENHRRALPWRRHHHRKACQRGHPYVDGSFRWQARGTFTERVCLICQRARNAERYWNGTGAMKYHRSTSPTCRNGHSWAEYGITRTDGPGRRCTKCDSESGRRRYEARKARDGA